MRSHAATALVVALLVGTAVAFAETERLKLEATPIEESFVQPAFSPVCGCDTAKAAIRLRLHGADEVTVRIYDASGRAVRVLVRLKRLPRGRTQLTWDGRNDAGARVPDGQYRVDVRLEGADRTYQLPHAVTVDTVRPRTRLVSYRPRSLRAGQRVRILYRISESAHGVLWVNGKRAVVTNGREPSGRMQWQAVSRGRYRLQLAALDLAGNLGLPTRVFVVRVRR